MEAGSSPGTAPAAAPKKGALWIVVAIVIAVALTAAVMDVVVFPMLKSTQLGPFERHLMTFDVGYDAPNFNPEWRVKTGQLVVVTMNNSGTMDHEFLLFAGDRAAILATVKYALALAESHHSGYLTNESRGNDTVDEYTGYHDSWANLSRVGCPDSCIDHDVAPGNTFLFWFVINTPGTYFFACHQVDRTDWKIHQDKNMWGTLIVST
jgi:uncharacterized cupredoxin-like copper-binding protein